MSNNKKKESSITTNLHSVNASMDGEEFACGLAKEDRNQQQQSPIDSIDEIDIESKVESVRGELNKLICARRDTSFDEAIIALSQRLDSLLVEYVKDTRRIK